jgi:uncharacterized protein YbjT (DUF2867 family)
MDAAERAGVKRYVMVSYLGSRKDHGISPENSFFPYAEAKAAADEHLRGTSLDWTIVAPSALTLEPGTGRIALADHTGNLKVSRDDVAAVVAAVLRTPSTIRKFIGFNQGETLISDALASL